MEKIFYVDKNTFPSSDEAIQAILAKYFGITDARINRSKNGKPYLAQELGLYLSVSHTNEMLFVGISDKELGIDAECLSREKRYAAIVKKFPLEEQAEICCNEDFLRHWTAKEAAVKYLGGTLSQDLKKLAFVNGTISHAEKDLPQICELRIEDTLLSICCERDFSHAEIIRWI